MTTKFTVKDLIALGKACEKSVKGGELDNKTEVVISLEVLKDGDEATYQNRVFGGSPVEIGVIRCLGGGSYPTIHLMGVPNFKVYGGG